jgi:hypothetical protein
MSTQLQRLTAALLADRNRIAPERSDSNECWVCGYAFRYRGRQGELNGRFCSLRCQDWHDGGNPRLSDINKIVYRDRNGAPMQPGRHGFHIRCASCHKEFESLGLRCCTADCERRYRERQDNLAVMAAAGVEPAAKKLCAAPGCAAVIPKWRKGRKVSSATRFCSSKCAQRANRATAPSDPPLTLETMK